MGLIHEQVLGILRTPPKFGCGLSVAGNVPNIQRYDATNGSYEPNYTMTPLTVQVDVAAIDGELPLTSLNGRTLLTNIHWYELSADGTRTEIVVNGNASTPPGYASLVNTEGTANAGELQIAKNAVPGEPIQLMFEGDVVYNSDVFHIQLPFSVQCRDTTPAVRCKFDTPDVIPFNPIHDATTMPISLSVWENNRSADPTHFIPVWEARREDGSWSEYGAELTDYWLDIASDKMSATLDMDLMGDGVSVRVRLRYDREGNPAAVTLAAGDLSVPFCRFEAVRSLGRYDHQMLNVTNTLAEWTTVIRPEIVFKDNKGNITDPDKFFRVTVYAGPVGSALTTANAVGTGRIVNIPRSRGSATGLKIGYSVDEIGPYKAWADADGDIITDADGAILLIR